MRRRVVVRVANAAAVTRPRMARYVTRQALTRPGGHGLPDVVLFCEVAPVDVTAVSSHHAPGFAVLQYGPTGSAAAGVAIASRRPIRAPRWTIGTRATREGGGIRLRPIVTGRTFGRPFSALHAPPARSPLARALFIARARATRGIVGGDFNHTRPWMRRTSLRRYVGLRDDVLGLLVPRRIRVGKAVAVDIGSDHPAFDVEMWLPTRRDR